MFVSPHFDYQGIKIKRTVCYSRPNNFICVTKFNIHHDMQSGSIHYRSFLGWCSSFHYKSWNISMSFYHTPTSFPVHTPADKTHEYLTVKAFSPSIFRPSEVIVKKAVSVPASDYKSCSKCHSIIQTLSTQHFHYQSHYWTPAWANCIYLSPSKNISLTFILNMGLQPAAHDAVIGHICKLCKYCKNYTII
jgi:hypothetical protein